MGNPVLHFEISGSDAERSRTFYRTLFGWSVELDPRGYGLATTGSDVGIADGIMQALPGAPAWVTVYVGVEDPVKSLAQAEELGGRRLMEAGAGGGHR